MNLIIMGAPGAGKGTQAEIISERYEIPTISTGATLREAIKSGSELGILAKSLIDDGKFVSDDVINPIVKTRLQQTDCENGFILDGYPRNMEQAKALVDMGIHIDRVLYIELSDETVIERLSGRRICENCGTSYHTRYNPSQTGELCELCGGKLITRKDDRPETVRERLEIFHKTTYPVVEYYKEKGILTVVQSDDSVEVTTERTLRALEEQL